MSLEIRSDDLSRSTGPYLFDPNRADGNKVGGTTGSNVMRVDPTPIAGGQMWENRDIPLHLAGQSIPAGLASKAAPCCRGRGRGRRPLCRRHPPSTPLTSMFGVTS